MSVGQGWDGRGLPPAAAARMQRYSEDGIRTSLLDVSSSVSAEAAGLKPVGEVMGCIVQQVGWAGWGNCGSFGYGGGYGAYGYLAQTITSGENNAWGGFAPLVRSMYHGYEVAIGRMTTEAASMGADGVIGVRLTVSNLDGYREYMALGTAVKTATRAHPQHPFVAALPGADVLKLMHAGWMPAAVAIGISVGVRHDDYRTQVQAGGGFGYNYNTEVAGYTDLVQRVRADARQQFHNRVHRIGADGAIVSSMDLRIHEHEPSEGHRDHIAESTVLGTSLVKFHKGHAAPTNSLTIMPLTGRLR